MAHPRDVEVFPNEGMTDPPKPFHLFAVRDEPGAPVARVDDHGHDVTDRAWRASTGSISTTSAARRSAATRPSTR